VKKVFTIRDPQYKDRDEEVEIYDNWKVIQGVNTPFSVLALHNGQIVRQQYIIAISYNNNTPAAYFTPVLIKHEEAKRKK
jgi:hypothetical protein